MSCNIRNSAVKCGLLLTQISTKHSNFSPLVFLRIQSAGLSTLKRSSLTQTSLLLQDGTSIQELPTIVRKLHGNDIEAMCRDEINAITSNNISDCANSLSENKNWESDEMIAGFERCYTAKGVFKLLEIIPSEEVTPEVAVQALKSIFRLENNSEYRNWTARSEVEEKPENFTRTAVLNNLISVVCQTEKPQVALEGLRAISKDVNNSASTDGAKEELCEKILILAADGRLSVLQVCEAVKMFALIDRREHGDKLWPGIVENKDVIDESNIVDVFRCLPYLRQSRRLVFSIAERQLADVWQKMSGPDIVDVLSALHTARCCSPRVLRHLAGWLSTNIHRTNEENLLSIVEEFRKMYQSEPGVDKALEKYVKAKGLRISNPALLASILEYCRKFKLRSPLILSGCSEYLMMRCHELSPPQIASLFYPLGLLDFLPPSGLQFWTVLESELQERFVQLHPSDALDILLACVYLEKHPLNFVKKVFNPYFLDRLHSVKQPALLSVLRRRLKVLDTALTLECPSYRGPLLPRDHSAKSLCQDGRIKRVANKLASLLQGKMDGNFSTSVVLGQLPLTEIYVVDLLLHPYLMDGSHLPVVKPGTCTAFLIHVPEHYDSSGEHLIGPQVMRHRHMRKIGLKVVKLDYNILAKLLVCPGEVRNYLQEQIELSYGK